MSTLLNSLKEWGCDVDGALERFVGDEELYVTCLNTVLTDNAFAGLGDALEKGEIQEAFDYAHTLKGVLANMGLTPMFDVSVRIVEPLRAGNGENLMPAYEELLQAKDKLAALVGAA